ncbi:MAG: hypothetical protein ABI910_01015 [Gemmatimonadota bacterium]
MSAGTAGASHARFTHAAPAHDGTSVIVFEYVGATPTTIRGPASGRSYRFNAPGDRAQVDARDRPALASLSTLRWVR